MEILVKDITPEFAQMEGMTVNMAWINKRIMEMESTVDSAHWDYKKAKAEVRQNDASIVAFGRLIQSNPEDQHTKQVMPDVEYLYKLNLKHRKEVNRHCAEYKRIWRRTIGKYNRLLSIREFLSQVLLEEWNTKHPIQPKNGREVMSQSKRRHIDIISEPVKFKVISEMYGTKDGFHAKVTTQSGKTFEV